MAEASNNEQPVVPAKESPNGAAGPSSESELSLAISDDVSLHLSPGHSRGSIHSPKATKPAGKIITSAKPKTYTTAGNAYINPLGQKHITAAKKASPSGVTKTKVSAKQPGPSDGKNDKEKDKGRDKCGMCDDQKEYKARCLNCQSSMCGSCINHHKKIAPDHELQDWDNFLTQNMTPAIPPVPAGKQICKVHAGEKLQFYCKVCLKPLCINCKLTKHEGHRTRDIWEEIQEQREMLPTKLGMLKASLLPLMKQQIQELEDYDKQVSYNVKGTIENIEKRTKVMKDEIDRTSSKMVEKLNQKAKRETESIEQRKKMLNGYMRNATTAITSGERIIKTGDDYEVMELFQAILEMIQKMQEIAKRKPGKIKYIFKDGQLSQSTLQTMFGGYIENGPTKPVAQGKTKSSTPSLQMVPEVHVRLLKTFTCKSVPGNKVSAIAPINDTEAWVSFGWTTNEIYLYNKDGFRKNRVLLRGPIDDLAVTHDGSLLVSTFSGNIVRHVDRKLQVRDFFQCPLKCRGITVSSGSEIIVCGVENCTATPPPVKSTIFKFTAKGNKTGHLDGDKTKKIPLHPYRVAENIDGSLAVSDWVSEKEGRVVIYSHDGKIRMVYYGNNNESRNFLPYGITTDKYGHVIVGDIINQEVHLLDIKGHFLRILLTKEDMDGERPYSLAVDPMNMLWVGNERAQIKIFRYLMNHSYIV